MIFTSTQLKAKVRNMSGGDSVKALKDGDWSTFTQGLLDIINGIVNAIWGVIQGLFHMFGIELDDFDGDWEAIWTRWVERRRGNRNMIFEEQFFVGSRGRFLFSKQI